MRKKVYKEFKLLAMLEMCRKLGEIEGMSSVLKFMEDSDALEDAYDDINSMAASLGLQFMTAETYIVDESHLMEIPEDKKLE